VSRLLAPAGVVLFTALAACAEEAPSPDLATETPSVSATPTQGTGPPRRYQRHIVFVGVRSDTLLAAAWLIDAAAHASGVDRTARAFLLRGSEWDTFLDERWSTEPTRVAWRIVPRGPLRMTVREGGALERMIHSAAPRELEMAFGDNLMDWTGRRGESVRLLTGGLDVGDAHEPGYVLDLSRAADPDVPPGGDWAFLVSGDSLQVVLHASDPSLGAAGNLFQAWARLDFRELREPALRIEWAESRTFERARRDVPAAWRLDEASGRWQGRLEVTSSLLRAGEGDQPQLPVDAIFAVRGTLTLEGADYPVQGIFRHTRE
jgi:hypothetical protein